MSAIGCHHALAIVVCRSAAEQASLGARRHAAAASLSISTTPRTSSNHRRCHRLVSSAAIDIPPYALLHPEATERSNNDNNNTEWGIEPAKEGDNKVKLWFQITGVGEVQEEVEVNLPRGSNVLTIKKKDKATKAGERLDVRLLLTEDYDMTGIEVKGGKKKEGDKVHLELTIVQRTISPKNVDIN